MAIVRRVSHQRFAYQQRHALIRPVATSVASPDADPVVAAEQRLRVSRSDANR